MTPQNDLLDESVLALSDHDIVSWRSLSEGVFISGAPGSGKSSSAGKKFAMAMLQTPRGKHRCGALILTAKAEETLNWIAYAKACGREGDLVVFNAESGLVFDPIHYEFTRPGRGAGDMESIIDFFSTLCSIGKKENAHGHDPFWERGNEQLMRNCIKLLELAGEPISIASIDRVIKSLPTQLGQHDDETFAAGSYCCTLVKSVEARQETLTDEQWSDLRIASQYLFTKWPAFDERPRSSLEMTWSGMADKFLFNPFNRLFCSGKCSFTPEDTTHRNKIIICDFPLLEYGHETGRLINVMIKLVFQRAWLRRKISESPNPIVLFQDEMQYFISRRDNFFQQTCRGSRIAVLGLTQNILNISEELGEDQPGSKTKSFLGNLGTHIYLQQNESESCNYAADKLGREYRYIDNYNGGGSPDSHPHFSTGGSRHLVHVLEPIEFTRLVKPSGDNPLAQAIVYQSGKTFNATRTKNNPNGRNYLSVFFSRE
jgi:hypothetical protein